MAIQLRALSRQEVRELDVQALTELGLPTTILMENAGRGAAALLADLATSMPPDAEGRPSLLNPSNCISDVRCGPVLPKVLVLCGPGNNGGDEAVLARHLDSWGFPVRVIWFTASDQLHGDAALHWTILKRSGVNQSAWLDDHVSDSSLEAIQLDEILTEAEWVVDGLLGTGLARPVEGLMLNVIEAMNRARKPILALDLPSGLDADTGQPLGTTVRALATATFIAAKVGFNAPGATAYTGQVTVIDIGLPKCLLDRYSC
jgi:NAD(P)H-hydrate epimerase